MPTITCYMCESEATSDEHAPPKCLFPERKDSPDGLDYRVNLITVSSCDKHNSAKSRNDEYLFQALAGSYTSSQLGLSQFTTKVNRSFQRSPQKAASLIKQSEPVLLKRHPADEWEQGAEIIVEAERLDEVLASCARALYFHETKRKFLGPVHVTTVFTKYNHPEAQANVTRSIEVALRFFANHQKKGQNPAVFWYKFDENENIAVFFMSFYSGSEVIVRLGKREVVPREP